MTTETIRDVNGKIVGYIDTDAQGNKVIKNFYRIIKGYYNAKDNVTRDFYRRIVAHGDVSASLLYKDK